MKSSTFQGVVRWSGGTMVLQNGQRFRDEHPLTKERPDLFADGDSEADVQGAPQIVETTMANGPAGGRVKRVQGGGTVQ